MIDFETIREDEVNAPRPKLLLADDSATIRKVVELTFADEGIEVTAVGDAASAMQEFVKMQPDIVLVEINLPGTSGYQICEMIKQDEATARIPVLLLVGSFEPFDQDEAERVGADGYLLKPFKSIRELVGRVKELLFQPPAGDPSFYEESAGHGGSGSDEWSQIQSSVGVSETTDIENLYQQSLEDTAEIQDFDTVDDLLTDSGMDDELIEEKYPFHRENQPFGNMNGDTSGSTDRAEFEEAFSPSNEADLAVNSMQVVSRDSAAETRLESVSEKPAESGATGVGQTEPPAGTFEPSDEFIALVVNRVVERISAREIRDVAREVVPRIAEKLIREALTEEKKS